jgi:3-hydroxyisobutyrate dehydrogenase-like beta-hydroxyacid dehydrogenase
MAHTRELGEKDLTLALELAEHVGVALPFTDLARRQLGHALGVPDEE